MNLSPLAAAATMLSGAPAVWAAPRVFALQHDAE